MSDSKVISMIPDFTEENYNKFCDAIPLEEAEKMFSYDEFVPTVEEHRKKAIEDGRTPQTISIDTDHFIAWCKSKGIEVNRSSLTKYTLSDRTL